MTTAAATDLSRHIRSVVELEHLLDRGACRAYGKPRENTLAAVTDARPWPERAACEGAHLLFDDADRGVKAAKVRALELCRACPVRALCEWAR